MTARSDTETFFQALAQHVIATAKPTAIVRPFEIGDGVYYQGSIVADHGYWRILGTDPVNRLVTITQMGFRDLVVNTKSVRHAEHAPLPALPQFTGGDHVYYLGSIEADHGYWQVVGTDPQLGIVSLNHRWSTRTLRCRPWHLEKIGE